MIATPDVGQHRLVVVTKSLGDVLIVAAPRPGLGCGGEEDLHVGIRDDHRSDVATLHHHAAFAGGQVSLQLHQPNAYRGPRGHRRDGTGHLVAPNLD